jgi:hypothetical protein
MLCDVCTSAHVHGLSADKLGLEGRLAVLEEHGDDLGGVGDSGDTVLNRSRVWYCVPGTPGTQAWSSVLPSGWLRLAQPVEKALGRGLENENWYS